ncbi:succinic semialdehyde dehydrogenase [Cellulomonas bogoriensis]|uniref:Succinate-semialdehyde dehydrogenase n=1 Tax=Cellulomonas bogoriensis 69B4 = DSM 16987 TaxID=1386082 RepID=A0A0A0BQ91_9CELL|nr:succinic semialdehyde dehydrogenase [Cellulomonas bogoriensis]KGM09817.1 succinate-semialdehyde dehydrogenase [Cellulomonas bogoriensis 69B4 = DSM 16987]
MVTPVVVDPGAATTPEGVLDPDRVREWCRAVVTSPGAGTRVVLRPATGSRLAHVPVSAPDDVDSAVMRARLAGRLWARTPVAQRTAVLRRFHDLLLERCTQVLDLLQLETGKSRSAAYEEVADVAQSARYYAHRARRHLAARHPRGLVPGLTRVRVHRRPVGVVGVVAPFNYPLSLSVGDAVPALAAGNGVVVKPDPQTALSLLWAVSLAQEAGLPEGLVQVVVGDGDVGARLAERADHVVFTGSSAVGREVGATAGRRLVGATLELGGKNAAYVTEDVDPAVVAEGLVRACFSGTGQLCVSVERLVLHESVADEVLRELTVRVRALRLGGDLDYRADVGCLTGPHHLERVQRHVDQALSLGARVVTGAVHRPDVGPWFYEPTILADVPAGADVLAEETFGPVVTVHRVTDDVEAMQVVADTEFGLAVALWCRDVRRARRLAAAIDVGIVTVNDGYAAAWGSPGAPVGGVKASGLGRRHGREAVEAVTWTQTVAVQHGTFHGWGLARLYREPGHRWTAGFTRALRVMKAVRMP